MTLPPQSSSGTLIHSVSGLRGLVGRGFDADVVARYAAALGIWAIARADEGGRGRTRAEETGRTTVVLGRDSRESGAGFAAVAAEALISVGCDVIELGIVPTPTTQLAVEHHRAGAGVMISASHNPIEWNALKFIGPDGVFLDAEAGAGVRAIAEAEPTGEAPPGRRAGKVRSDPEAVARHLDLVLRLQAVDVPAIQSRRFHVALDCVRGAGGRIIPSLLERLGCRVTGFNLETDGRFPREPEPIPENLGELGELVRRSGADIGMAVDPDVDRLALTDEQGLPIGEDYTLAFAVRGLLGRAGGQADRRTEQPVVVANLSTSLVVADAARACGARLVRAPVGEAHVARAILAEGAVIGGEGNGGVILPALHIGRDAPLGVALVLQYLTTSGESVSGLVKAAPRYRIVKAKAPRQGNLETAYLRLAARFPDALEDRRDGLRLSWADRWVHLRPSGTEPILRIIAEAPSEEEAGSLVAASREALGNGPAESGPHVS